MGIARIALLACALIAAVAYAEDAGSGPKKIDPCLKLLIVLFRHGDRAPLWPYPTDPYKNSSYPPGGLGNLNAAGKRHAFELGRFLRQRYDRFLGEGMEPGKLALRSTEVPRALESGQLVVAGAFPPTGPERWGTGLGSLWHPVSFKTLPKPKDRLLQPGFACPAALLDMPQAEKAVWAELDKIKVAVDFIIRSAGVDPQELRALERVADTLIAQDSCGMKLPDWAARVYPDPMRKIIAMVMGTDVYSRRQRRLTAGVFLHEIVNVTLAYQQGQLPFQRKLHLYSAHDTTLLPVLAALRVWDRWVPPFSSAIIFEVHRCHETDQPSIKVLYRNDTISAEPVLLEMPGCAPTCPLGTFMTMYKDYILTSDRQEMECFDV